MKRTSAIILSLLLVLSIFTPFSAFAEGEAIVTGGSYEFELYTQQITQESIDLSRAGAVTTFSTAELASAATAYNLIKEAMLNGETELILTAENCSDYSKYNTTTTYSNVANLAISVMSDNPEIFYYTNGARVGWTSDGSSTLLSVDVDFFLLAEHTNLEADKAAFNAAIDKVLDDVIYDGMTDLEKEMAIHDYIVLNCAYDTSLKAPDTFNAYGVLIRKTAVCDGYARTFKLFMDRLGIPCQYVTGIGNGGPHAWNRVQIGGHWYQIDVTWGDPVPDAPGKISYQHFNVDDASFKSPTVSGISAHTGYDESTKCTDTSFANYRYLKRDAAKYFTDDTVVYTVNTAGISELFTMNVNGSGKTKLNTNPMYAIENYEDMYLYFSDVGSGIGINSIKRDGTGLTKLASASTTAFSVTGDRLNYTNTAGAGRTLDLPTILNSALKSLESQTLITDCELDKTATGATASMMVIAKAWDRSVKSKLYLAVYDASGKMIGIQSIPANVPINQARTFDISVSAESGKTVSSAKLFMLDSNMQPYMVAMTK